MVQSLSSLPILSRNYARLVRSTSALLDGPIGYHPARAWTLQQTKPASAQNSEQLRSSDGQRICSHLMVYEVNKSQNGKKFRQARCFRALSRCSC